MKIIASVVERSRNAEAIRKKVSLRATMLRLRSATARNLIASVVEPVETPKQYRKTVIASDSEAIQRNIFRSYLQEWRSPATGGEGLQHKCFALRWLRADN